MTPEPVARAEFLAELAERLAVAKAEGSIVGVAVVDLRHFHRINGLYGFAAGDALLAQVRSRLDEIARKSPFVRRVGGDAFGILFSGIASPELLAMIGSRIVRALGEPVMIDGQEIGFDVEVGLAAFPQDAVAAEPLFFLAEQAARRARRIGKPYALHEPQEQAGQRQAWELERELGEALSTNALQLWYQPSIALPEAAPARPEALLRWLAPDRRVVPPDRIVPVIEQAGRGLELARWVLNTALRQARKWPGLGVTINLSPAALGHPGLGEMLASSLRLWGVEPSQLTVDIAEYALVRGAEACRQQLQPLREAGVRIAVDDFGAGGLPLSQLASLPVDELKLDRALVAAAVGRERERAVCEYLVGLARRLGLRVVAVGIEDEPALALFRALGCDAAQGYRIGWPMGEADFAAWVRDNAAPA